MSRISKSIETESRLVDTQGWGVRTGSDCKWAQNYAGSDKNVLEKDIGDSYTTVNLLKGTELYTQNK